MRSLWWLFDVWRDAIDALLNLRGDGWAVGFDATTWLGTGAQPWNDWDFGRTMPTTFKQTNLISDGSVPAQTTDPNLINPWGVAYGSVGTGGEFWISDAGTGLTSIDSVAAPLGARVHRMKRECENSINGALRDRRSDRPAVSHPSRRGMSSSFPARAHAAP